MNLEIGKGESLDLHIDYLAPDETPIDLTGYSVEFRGIKTNTGDTFATVPGEVDSLGNIDFLEMATEGWPSGGQRYLVALTYPSGQVKWILTGSLAVLRGNE